MYICWFCKLIKCVFFAIVKNLQPPLGNSCTSGMEKIPESNDTVNHWHGCFGPQSSGWCLAYTPAGWIEIWLSTMGTVGKYLFREFCLHLEHLVGKFVRSAEESAKEIESLLSRDKAVFVWNVLFGPFTKLKFQQKKEHEIELSAL